MKRGREVQYDGAIQACLGEFEVSFVSAKLFLQIDIILYNFLLRNWSRYFLLKRGSVDARVERYFTGKGDKVCLITNFRYVISSPNQIVLWSSALVLLTPYHLETEDVHRS